MNFRFSILVVATATAMVQAGCASQQSTEGQRREPSAVEQNAQVEKNKPDTSFLNFPRPLHPNGPI